MKSAAFISPKSPQRDLDTPPWETPVGVFSAHAGLDEGRGGGGGGGPEYRLVPTELPVFLIIAPLSLHLGAPSPRGSYL